MSKLSFKSFCIEFYSDYKGIRSDEVFKLFEKAGVIAMLDDDYEDLHGFGMEYLVRFIDEYLERKAASI